MAISRRVRIPQALTNIVITVQFGPRNWLRGIRAPRPGTAQAGKGWSVRGRLAALAEMFCDQTSLGAVDEIRPGPDFPPFAVIWGDSNLGLSPRAGRALNRTLQPDREEFLTRCGHLPMMESPEEVTAIITEFIARPPARRLGDLATSPGSA